MPTRYVLRIQFGPHQDPHEVAQRLRTLCREARVDEVLLFLFAEELNNGHDTPEQIEAWLTWSRPLQKALRADGVRLSLNPWHSLLHVDRGRRLKPSQPWQSMQDPQGRSARAVVCPLDEGWRDYYRATLARYAREDFDVIWIDDDIRYHNHGDLAWGGCFCPLHMAAFSDRVGRSVSREELVRACTAARRAPPLARRLAGPLGTAASGPHPFLARHGGGLRQTPRPHVQPARTARGGRAPLGRLVEGSEHRHRLAPATLLAL
jgi:hypothetical protein